MRFRFMLFISILLAAPNSYAQSFDETREFVQTNGGVATVIGILKFCGERSGEDEMTKLIVKKTLSGGIDSNSYDRTATLTQAIDFYALGIANGLKVSGMTERARTNICRLGLEHSQEMLLETRTKP